MGAFSNEGLFWIAPSGKVIPVDKRYSHEEYANVKWNVSLEEALEKKYIRIQSIIGRYLFVDHRQKEIKNSQIPSLENFFSNEYSHIVVERSNSDIKEFNSKQSKAALSFTINGKFEDEENELNRNAGLGRETQRREDLPMVNPYYRSKSSAFGDSVINFKQWLRLNGSIL